MKPKITFQGRIDEFYTWLEAMSKTYGQDSVIQAEIFVAEPLNKKI